MKLAYMMSPLSLLSLKNTVSAGALDEALPEARSSLDQEQPLRVYTLGSLSSEEDCSCSHVHPTHVLFEKSTPIVITRKHVPNCRDVRFDQGGIIA